MLGIIGACAALTFTAPARAQKDTDLTAIDILLNPGEAMINHAKEANTRLLENYPEGFALGKTHHPHISVLQRYVRTKDLDKVYAAVQQVIAAENPVGMELKATGYYFLSWKGLGLAGIVIKPTPALLRFQKKLIDAVAPFTAADGTAAAFVPRADGGEINKPTVDVRQPIRPEGNREELQPARYRGGGQGGLRQEDESRAVRLVHLQDRRRECLPSRELRDCPEEAVAASVKTSEYPTRSAGGASSAIKLQNQGGVG